jgi:hypothetical protein
MSTRFSRRRFLKTTGAVAGAAAGLRAFGAPAVLSAASPNSKLAVAVIGCMNQAFISVNDIARLEERIVALVDVDDSYLAACKEKLSKDFPDLKTSEIQGFSDYRKMFDKIHKQIDAVFVCVPDHHHAAAAMMAMQLGKHIYVEKPMAKTIAEARMLTEAARKYKVITQMGNQGHSGEGIRRLREYIEAGAIGNVTETFSWAPTGRGGVGGRLPSKPVPAGLHWEEWIGPAPYRDYHDDLHPKEWRTWWDFGCGSSGDWGCHNLDGVFTALKLGYPTSAEAMAQVGGSQERFPTLNTIRWEFPAREGMPAVKAWWFDGYRDFDAKLKDKDPVAAQKAQNRPPIVLELEKQHGRDLKNGGTVYVGDKGIMVSGNYVGSPRIVPEEKHKEFPVPDKKYPRIKGTHQGDFIRACKDGKPACSHFDYAGPFTEMVLVGCLAIRAGVGKKVQWDGPNMKCTNLPELNSLVKREYRKGWGL